MKSRWAIAALAVVLTAGAAWAHSYLAQSAPAEGETLTVLPKTVRLEFTEPIEVGFSSFKLYRVDTRAIDAKAAAKDAEAHIKKWLEAKNDDAQRADAGTNLTSGTAARIEIKLKDKLEPGWYAVVWKVLSIDTHVSSDSFVFRYKP